MNCSLLDRERDHRGRWPLQCQLLPVSPSGPNGCDSLVQIVVTAVAVFAIVVIGNAPAGAGSHRRECGRKQPDSRCRMLAATATTKGRPTGVRHSFSSRWYDPIRVQRILTSTLPST
jgi:hypothetical protein